MRLLCKLGTPKTQLRSSRAGRGPSGPAGTGREGKESPRCPSPQRRAPARAPLPAPQTSLRARNLPSFIIITRAVIAVFISFQSPKSCRGLGYPGRNPGLSRGGLLLPFAVWLARRIGKFLSIIILTFVPPIGRSKPLKRKESEPFLPAAARPLPGALSKRGIPLGAGCFSPGSLSITVSGGFIFSSVSRRRRHHRKTATPRPRSVCGRPRRTLPASRPLPAAVHAPCASPLAGHGVTRDVWQQRSRGSRGETGGTDPSLQRDPPSARGAALQVLGKQGFAGGRQQPAADHRGQMLRPLRRGERSPPRAAAGGQPRSASRGCLRWAQPSGGSVRGWLQQRGGWLGNSSAG